MSTIWIWRLRLTGTRLRKWLMFNMGIFTRTSSTHWEIRIENYSLRWPATLMARRCTRAANSRCGRSLHASTSCEDQYDSTWKTWSVSKISWIIVSILLSATFSSVWYQCGKKETVEMHHADDVEADRSSPERFTGTSSLLYFINWCSTAEDLSHWYQQW